MNYNLTFTADQKERLLDALDVDHQHLHANMPPDESDREWRAAVEANEALQKMLAHAEVDPTGLPLQQFCFAAWKGTVLIDVIARTEKEARDLLAERMRGQNNTAEPLGTDDEGPDGPYWRLWLTEPLLEALVLEESYEVD